MSDGLLYLVLGLIVINLLAFILVGMDKQRSVDNQERVREVYYFFIAVFFASLGVFLGMFFFRHKTRKIYFPLGIGLLLVEQALLLTILSKVIKF